MNDEMMQIVRNKAYIETNPKSKVLPYELFSALKPKQPNPGFGDRNFVKILKKDGKCIEGGIDDLYKEWHKDELEDVFSLFTDPVPGTRVGISKLVNVSGIREIEYWMGRDYLTIYKRENT
jgi:hypothetical protein